MPRYYAITIEIDGRRYTGDWRLCQGGVLAVGSAWGGITVEIGADEPVFAAQAALARIVREDQARRAAEVERQAAEMEKLRRPQNAKKPPPR